MIREIRKDNTLIVSGSASLSLIEGDVECFGYKLRERERVIVRRGKTLPFKFNRDGKVELILGEGGGISQVEGDTIPPSWKSAIDKIIEGGRRVAILGDVDSGKTSMSIYLANMALRKGLRKIAILDGDVGQAELGAPTTLALGEITKPILDLASIRPVRAFYVGAISPEKYTEKVLTGIQKLSKLAENCDMLVINTDGWIHGGENYKAALINKCNADIAVILKKETSNFSELISKIRSLSSASVIEVEAPKSIKARGKEERKLFRHLGYKRHLKDSRVRIIPYTWVKLIGFPIGTGVPLSEKDLEAYQSKLGLEIIYGEATPEHTTLVVTDISGREREFNFHGRLIKLIQNDELRNVMIGILDEEGFLESLGVLLGVDYKRRTLRILTPIKEQIKAIELGYIKYDIEHGEI